MLPFALPSAAKWEATTSGIERDVSQMKAAAPATSSVYYVRVTVAGTLPLAIPFLSETLSPSFTVTLPAESLGVTIAADGSGVVTAC